MPIESIIRKNKNLIEMKFSGEISFEEFRKELEDLVNFAAKNEKMNYLLDFREAKPKGKSWTTEMINPWFWKESAKFCKGIALLVPPSSINSLQIFNIVTRNAGLKFKAFATDSREANEWLGISSPSEE